MTDALESPAAFAMRLADDFVGLSATPEIVAEIAARDRRVREEALREAARVCDTVCDDYRNRRTTPNWTAEDAAERIRALASGDSDDR